MDTDSLGSFTILTAVIIVLFTIVYYLWQKKRKSRKSILLLGLSFSGKTTLFCHLTGIETKGTFTSMSPNIGFYKSKNKYIRIVDIPGNEKVRQKYLDQHKADASGIIYVIDSTIIQRDLRDVAELLYIILTDGVIKSNCRRVLLLCNKQDGSLAKSKTVIHKLIEQELDVLRGTKTKQLEAFDNVNKSSILGSKDVFDFSQCKPIDVEVAESIIDSEIEEVKMQEISEWLSKFK